jgi:hypothetical protein
MENQKSKKKLAKGGGKETLFRVTIRNQIRIVGIIDRKANTIIGVSTLIVTLILGLLGGNLAYSESHDLSVLGSGVPFFILLFFELFAILFALISTQFELVMHRKEKIGGPMEFTLLRNEKFGLKDYLERMDEILSSNEELYKVLSLDAFFLRKVIQGKRRYLNIAYLFFILGFILSVVVLFYFYV